MSKHSQAIVLNDQIAVGLDEIDDIRQNLIGEPSIIACHNDPQRGALPLIVVADLGNRHVKLVANPILETAQDRSLGFQRVRAWNT